MKTDDRARAVALAGLAMLPSSTLAANASSFANRAEAEAFIAHALPEATAANPKFKDPEGDTSTRWLTKTVTFGKDESGGVVVSMREDILKYRGEEQVSQGAHDSHVPLELTGVGLISEAWAPVDTLDAAAGILFRCPEEPCIRSSFDDKATLEKQTDITIADKDKLAKLYEAFRALLKGSGLP